MKRSIILTMCLVVLTSTWAFAQDVGGTTLVSQSRKTAANIGKCEIEIKYHSPSVNGRKIFGGIVPFDFVVDGKEFPWRAGSNQRTTIDFSHPVEIEGQSLDSGSYGFVVLVSEKEWTLIFSAGKSWGAFNYDPSNDVLRIPVKTKHLPFQEWLSYEFINPTHESVVVRLRWENTAVDFRIASSALDNILMDLQAKANKSTPDFQELALRTLEVDPRAKVQAMKYLEQSFELLDSIENENLRKVYEFNYKILKSEWIDEEDPKLSEQLMQEAWEMASGFNMYYYALNKYMVEGKQKEALNILKRAVKENPDNFQNHFAFGEYYLKAGDQKKATAHFKMAYEMTVEQESGWKNYAEYLYQQNKLVLESIK